MFDEKIWKELKKTKQFKGYARNCFLGFIAVFVIAVVLISFGFTIMYGQCEGCDVSRCLPPVIIGFAVAAVMITLAIYLSIYKKQPYMCTIGIIESVDRKYAVIKAGNEEIKGNSFERFLRAGELDNYSAGDEVIVYSSVKKHGRPLFMKTK